MEEHSTANEGLEDEVDVELESVVGPRVLVAGDLDEEEILASLPSGWTIHDGDWTNGVRTPSGRMSYPLSLVVRDPRLIFDNGGGIVLQLGSWAHSYDQGSEQVAGEQCATDVVEWLKAGTTDGWEGDDMDALGVDPDADEIRNGGYEIVRLDRDVDTLANLAEEIASTGGAAAVAVAVALATKLLAGPASDAAIVQPIAIRYEDAEWFAVYRPGSRIEDVGYDSLAELLRAHSLASPTVGTDSKTTMVDA